MMRTLLIAAAACSFGGCSIATEDVWTAREMRSASDLPPQFVTEDGVQPEESACRNPLIDPRDQTRLRLIRSISGGGGRGDYEVTGGKYGVGPNELLRINCSTGEALGIVRS